MARVAHCDQADGLARVLAHTAGWPPSCPTPTHSVAHELGEPAWGSQWAGGVRWGRKALGVTDP